MRIVVATDSIGALTSAQAGRVIASGWSGQPGIVVPVGEAGRGFAQAIADQWGTQVVVLPEVAPPGGGARLATAVIGPQGVVLTLEPGPMTSGGSQLDRHGSSLAAGAALRDLLPEAAPGGSVLVDLTWSGTHDGGAGFLAGLGAIADVDLAGGVDALQDLGRVDLAQVRAALGGRTLVGVVPEDQVALPLCGLRGITSLKARGADVDPAVMLLTDASLERLATLLEVPPTGAGTGACGGVGLAVLALGGTVTSGAALTARTGGLAEAVAAADLVVTGTGVFDFARRGGGVLAQVARTAAEALRPCIVVAGEVLIGSREMRTMGIESAYAVRDSVSDVPLDDVGEPELAATAARVARTWRW